MCCIYVAGLKDHLEATTGLEGSSLRSDGHASLCSCDLTVLKVTHIISWFLGVIAGSSPIKLYLG